ncbi:hypothetical protein BC826DRAFT_1015123 [Russula brevipes]|nr:hypothetical protein BC826DRAFT_1015123 [Russula brevipes]
MTRCMKVDPLDPKAVQHVLHKPGYHYDKAAPRAHFNELVVGKGLVSVGGQTHQRQRKVINPAFDTPQLRSFLSLFYKTASKLVQKWNDKVIATDPSGQPPACRL